jgi:hypothetical protein
MSKSINLALILLAACWAASIYWSPYQTCVRSQMEDQPPATRADANLICARWLRAN